MSDLPVSLLMALGGLAVGLAVGISGRLSRFCTFCAINDLVRHGDTVRLKGWALAIAAAMVGVNGLAAAGLIDVSQTIYLAGAFGWGGALIGGAIFGVGMALTGSCGYSLVIRSGGGDLKAVIALIIMGLSAYMAARGLTGLGRVEWIDPLSLDLSASGGHGLAALLGDLSGLDAETIARPLPWAIAGGLAVWSLADARLRARPRLYLPAVVIGLAAVSGFAVTGILGADDFDPAKVESVSFIMPAGNAILYLLTFTGASINFGIALLFGTIAGSFVASLARSDWTFASFQTPNETVRILTGAFLMGFGGVTALGCTIGQGITGVATLSGSSILAVAAIFAGAAVVVQLSLGQRGAGELVAAE